MQYYVCNSPDPMNVPWGVGAQFYATEAAAVLAVKEDAERNPGMNFYVHAFPESSVIFKARGRVEMEMEYLGDSE